MGSEKKLTFLADSQRIIIISIVLIVKCPNVPDVQ